MPPTPLRPAEAPYPGPQQPGEPDPFALVAGIGSGLGVSAGTDGSVVHDPRLRPHWARITAGPTTGMYAHVEVYRDSSGVWTNTATEAPYAYGTAAVNGWPARAANGETLTVGGVYWLRPEEAHPDGPGWLAATGGGGGAELEVVKATANNDGTSGVWTTAILYTQDAAGLPTETVETVAVYPFPGHTITTGNPYGVWRDTGLLTVTPSPPPPPGSPTPATAGLRKLWVHGVKNVALPPLTVVCNSDGTITATWTKDLRAPNLQQSP